MLFPLCVDTWQGLDRQTDNILARAQPKTCHGQYLSGSALAAFAQAYCSVINKGQVPTISSTWQVRAWLNCFAPRNIQQLVTWQVE